MWRAKTASAKRRETRASLGTRRACLARAPVRRKTALSRPKRARAKCFTMQAALAARRVASLRSRRSRLLSMGHEPKKNGADRDGRAVLTFSSSFPPDRANIGLPSHPRHSFAPTHAPARVRSEARANRALRREADSTVDRAPRIAGKATAARRTQPRRVRRTVLFSRAGAR